MKKIKYKDRFMYQLSTVIILLFNLNCVQSQEKEFKNSHNSFINTLKENQKNLFALKNIDDIVTNTFSPEKFGYSPPMTINVWGYTEFAIEYNLDDTNVYYPTLSDKCKSNLNLEQLEESYINDNLTFLLKKCDANIPQIKYNQFYKNLDQDKTEVYILNSGKELIIKDEYLPSGYVSNNNHGYVVGLFIDSEKQKLIFWILAW